MKKLEEFREMVMEKYKEQHTSDSPRTRLEWHLDFEVWVLNEMYGMYKEFEGYREIAESIPTEP